MYGSANDNNNYDISNNNNNNQPPVFLQVSYSFTITNCAPNAFVGVVQVIGTNLIQGFYVPQRYATDSFEMSFVLLLFARA